jgi:methionyl-tRNA formyltransferase
MGLNLFICGQKSFGAEVFEKLLSAGHRIVGVAAPANTGDSHDSLTAAAEKNGSLVVPAGTLRALSIPKGVDLIVAAFCHDFIGQATRARARLGGIGYHPSLLPRHKGRDSVEWTIRMRDPVTGGTVYWLSNECDGGDIAAQEHCFVRPGDTAKTLYRRELYPTGVRLICRVVEDISKGLIIRHPQDKSVATWEPAIGRAPIFKPELPQLPHFDDERTLVRFHGLSGTA